MITPRRFSLMNGNGEELDLLTTSLFLYEPEGLGYKRDDEYRRVGNRWILVNTAFSQDPVSGKICFFTDDPYILYFNFIKFTQVSPLILIYKPVAEGRQSYRRYVRISKIEKGEVNKHGYLECPIDFLPLAPWYKPGVDFDGLLWNEAGWVLDTDQNSIRWNDTFSSTPGYVSIISDSNMDSPCRLTIYGPITNPFWTHYVGSTEYENGLINVQVKADEKLIVDNTMDPYSIRIYDENNEIVQNAYQLSDFSTRRFINIQPGVNTITFGGSDYGDKIVAKAEGMICYESV